MALWHAYRRTCRHIADPMSCGAVVELDRTAVGIKYKLGKTVECRKCRNARIAREKEEEDIAFTGVKEEEEW